MAGYLPDEIRMIDAGDRDASRQIRRYEGVGARFQVLSRGLTGPGPYDHGWKDTVDLRPAEEATVIARFDDYPGRYVFHCHNLEHEDMAMMGSFVVE